MSKTKAGLPNLDAEVGGLPVDCSACGHPAIIAPKRGGIRRLLGLRPRPAECTVREYDMSGLAALPCGCTNPAHGF